MSKYLSKASRIITKKYKALTAFALAFMFIFGDMAVLAVFAQEVLNPASQPMTVQFMGEEVQVSADGIARIDMGENDVNAGNVGSAGIAALGESADASTDDNNDNYMEFQLSRHIHIDGERVSIDDERISNIIPIFFESASNDPRQRLVGTSLAGQITSGQEPTWNRSVIMSGHGSVSPIRYQVTINGVSYEAFCADPQYPGPEQASQPYVILGEAPHLLRVLRYGFPHNYALIDTTGVYFYQESYAAYVTRIAVAIANNPSRTFSGDTQIITSAENLRDGVSWETSFYARDYENTRPAIAINSERHAEDLGREFNATLQNARSNAFNVTHNRITHNPTNPFYFEWGAAPAGARLIVNNNAIATAPTNPTGRFDGSVSFHIEMPNEQQFENEEATVYLIGVNNEHAGRAWRSQIASDPDGWQDIVFYLPYIRSSATFSFIIEDEPYTPPTPTPTPSPTPEPTPPEPYATGVVIQKIDALSRENIPGALMRLRGASSMTIVTGSDLDGVPQSITFDNTGINLSQVLTAGATTALPNGVTSTVTDGVWTLEGLPFGFYIWDENTDKKSTQIIFCDTSTPSGKKGGKDGFNVYDDIKKKLIAKGIPENEIAFIHDSTSEKQREQLFAKVRQGKIRVLLGSTQKLGAGTNVQKRLIALHDLDAPWRPRDLIQRAGRGWRQGNDNKDIYIFRYATEKTFDAYLYQILEQKMKYIAQIMTSKSPVRVCEDIDDSVLSFAEIKALCAGNPKIKEKMELDMEVAKLKMLSANHKNVIYQLEDSITQHFPRRIEGLKQLISGLEKDISRLNLNTKPHKDGISPMKVGKYSYNERKAAGEAIVEFCSNNFDEIREKGVDIGNYRGFDMQLIFKGSQFHMQLKGALTASFELGSDPVGNTIRIDNALEKFDSRLTEAKSDLADYQQQLENAKEEVKKPFPQEQELLEKSARLAVLNAELEITNRRDEPGEDLEDEQGASIKGELNGEHDDISDIDGESDVTYVVTDAAKPKKKYDMAI